VSIECAGTVNGWEYSGNGAMTRVELDRDRGGRADAWMRYVNGIVTSTETDEDGDGEPDGAQNDTMTGCGVLDVETLASRMRRAAEGGV